MSHDVNIFHFVQKISSVCRLATSYSQGGIQEKAAEYLHQAEDIYKVVPGEDSAFYIQQFSPVLDKIMTSS